MQNTRYRYFTKDGGPPNGGAPPGAPSGAPPPFLGPPPPPGPSPFFIQGAPPAAAPPQYICHPVGGPPLAAPPPFVCHSIAGPPPPPPGPPGAVWIGPSPPSAPPPGAIYIGPSTAPPPPGPPPGAVYIGPAAPAPAAAPPPPYDLPPRGNRVRGVMPKFPNQSTGYIFPKKNTTVELYKGAQKPWEWQGLQMDFTVHHAPVNMTIREFIEQLGAPDRAAPGTPPEWIGIVEILEAGNGRWHKGTQFLLGDPENVLSQTLEQVGWDAERGEAGRAKPVRLMCLP